MMRTIINQCVRIDFYQWQSVFISSGCLFQCSKICIIEPYSWVAGSSQSHAQHMEPNANAKAPSQSNKGEREFKKRRRWTLENQDWRRHSPALLSIFDKIQQNTHEYPIRSLCRSSKDHSRSVVQGLFIPGKDRLEACAMTVTSSMTFLSSLNTENQSPQF